MAIYEPTNIMPSTFTNSGTVAANDKVNIQWQINGNSALQGFQIDMYANNAQSNLIKSTGYLTAKCPFNGVDKNGKPTYFSYSPGETWEKVFALLDGNNYKFKITQWFNNNNSIARTGAMNLKAGKLYYFTLTDGAYSGGVIYFAVTTDVNNVFFNYSFTTGIGWFEIDNGENMRISVTTAGYNPNGAIPENAELLNNVDISLNLNYGIDFIQQTSEAAFITRTRPVLNLHIKNISEGVLSSSIANFYADFTQAQGDGVKWVRWKIADISNGKRTLLDDTLEIYTSTLRYEYNGLFNGDTYAVCCTIETEKGVQVTTGWVEFKVSYEENSYWGELAVQQFKEENSVRLDWEPAKTIPAKATPLDGYTILPQEGAVELNAKSNIIWDSIDNKDNSMEFNPPWSAAWKGKISSKKRGKEDIIFEGVTSSYSCSGYSSFKTLENDGFFSFNQFSPDGKILLSGIGGKVYAYSVNGDNLTFLKELTEGLTEQGTDWRVYKSGIFSPNSKLLILLTNNSKPTLVYSINGTQITQVNSITVNGSDTGWNCDAVSFTPDGNLLVVLGYINTNLNSDGYYDSEDLAKFYSISGTTITYIGDIKKNGATPLLATSPLLKISNAGKVLLIEENDSPSGSYSDKNGLVSAYSISGTTITYIGDIKKNGATIKGRIRGIDFNHSGNIFVVCWSDSSAFPSSGSSAYSISGTTITYIGDINRDGNTVESAGHFARFNNNDSLVCLVESYGNYSAVDIYSVVDLNFKKIKSIKKSETLYSILFNESDSTLLLAYKNDTGIEIYSVLKNEINYYDKISKETGDYYPYPHIALNKDDMLVVDNCYTSLLIPRKYSFTAHKEFTKGEILNVKAIELDGVEAIVNVADNIINVVVYSTVAEQQLSVSVSVDYLYNNYLPQGELFSLTPNGIALYRQDAELIIKVNNEKITSFTPPEEADSATVIISPTAAFVHFFTNKVLVKTISENINYTQKQINAVAIYGGDYGAVVKNLSIFNGYTENILVEYSNADFEPVWNSDEYSLYMTSNFDRNIEGGTGTATGNNGFYICRRETNSSKLKVIARVNSLVECLKDFSIVSGKEYIYYLFAYDNNMAFMSSASTKQPITTKFQSYSLLVTEYNEADDAYHVVKQYLFKYNISHGSVSNNNSPSLTANFTRYPTRMGSAQNYDSGTLQALIGVVSDNEYYDSIELERELKDLSTSTYTLFMRDMEGHIRMVHTNGAITMEPNLKTRQMQKKISFPWVEIGDASEAMIIQLSTDIGWKVDEDVLDVAFDVDLQTGQLIAKYPLPYGGTKFSIGGDNKTVLIAKTPKVMSVPIFELPDSTEDDEGKFGVLTVKVTRNTTDED